MTFYAKDGLSFRKLPGGEVQVILDNKDVNIRTLTLDPDTWASAVAAVSAEGDTAEGFETALAFHLGKLKRVRKEPPTAI